METAKDLLIFGKNQEKKVKGILKDARLKYSSDSADHKRHFCIDDIGFLLKLENSTESKSINNWEWNTIKALYKETHSQYVKGELFPYVVPKKSFSGRWTYIDWTVMLRFLPKLPQFVKDSNSFKYLITAIDFAEVELNKDIFQKVEFGYD